MNEDSKAIVTIDHDGFMPVPPAEGSIIAGTFLKYTKETGWTAMEESLPDNLQLLVLSVDTCLQHWEGGQVIDAIFDKPLPDLKPLNDAIDQKTWELDLVGKPKPPWSKTYVVYLLDEQTCEKYTYANSTWSARLAWETLTDRVAWMRKLRGANVLPVVALSTAPMKTRYGTQPRPNFRIIAWKQLGGGGNVEPIAALPAPGIKEVPEPTLSEHMGGDEVPWSDPIPEALGGSPKPPAPSVEKPQTTMTKRAGKSSPVVAAKERSAKAELEALRLVLSPYKEIVP
jgi:hypothetical protein